jgi:hypothetical protein
MTPFDIAIVVFAPLAVGIGIWAGLRRARELRAIARDRLGAQLTQAPTVAPLRMTQSPGNVRPFFRVLGFAAGPLMLLGGIAFLGMSLHALVVNGFQGWWPENREFTVTGVGCLALGILITRAAVTGRDPYLR